MFTITANAAEQINIIAGESHTEDKVLRVAARQMSDGGVDYTMGFDERNDNDILFESHGVNIVFAGDHQELLENTTLDYVELDDGEKNFIFVDPKNTRHLTSGEV